MNCQGGLGQTPLERAMLDNHDRVVELLLSHGADIPPLHLALYCKDEAKAKELAGHGASVESLIEAGANVNVRTVNGTTPLMVAAAKGYSDIVRVLLDHGARHDVRKSDGTTALSIAEKGGFTRTAELIRRAHHIQNVTAAAAAAPRAQAAAR